MPGLAQWALVDPVGREIQASTSLSALPAYVLRNLYVVRLR